MSMITEFVERLREQGNFLTIEQGAFEVGDMLNDAADVIEELSAKLQAANMERSSQYYNGGWISVKDKLPEDFKDVLVYFEYYRYGDYNCMYSTCGIGTYASQHESWLVNHETGWKNLHVFAWMPLPPEYKESEG